MGCSSAWHCWRPFWVRHSGLSANRLIPDMKLSQTTHLGQPCLELANNAIALGVAQEFGPRILSLRANGGPNLFAEMPYFTLTCPGVGELRLWGGHRLWHAPEVARRTYLPDDQPVAIEPVARGILVTQPLERDTGMRKRLRITLPDESATVVVEHMLENEGMWPVTCAPWAITQLRPGGTAVLPQPLTPSDPDGLQPNRSVALWPYTDVRSPHITWGNSAIFVQATLTQGALKLGFPGARGWMGYVWQDTLFVKRAQFDPQAHYLDRGSSNQCYANSDCLELETLGPETTILPGTAVTHREIWQVFCGVQFVAEETAVADLAAQLGLDEQ